MSAHTSSYTVKLKHPTERTRRKTYFWVKEDFKNKKKPYPHVLLLFCWWCNNLLSPLGVAVSHTAAAAPLLLAESLHPSYPECKFAGYHGEKRHIFPVSPPQQKTKELFPPLTWKHPLHESHAVRRPAPHLAHSPEKERTNSEWPSWQRRSCTQR